jgi:hypothetical protein
MFPKDNATLHLANVSPRGITISAAAREIRSSKIALAKFASHPLSANA